MPVCGGIDINRLNRFDLKSILVIKHYNIFIKKRNYMKFIRITIFTAFLLSSFAASYCSQEQPAQEELNYVSIDETDARDDIQNSTAVEKTAEQPIARKKSFDGTRDAWFGGAVGSGYWTLDHYGQDYGTKVCAIGSDEKALDRWSVVATAIIQAKDIVKTKQILDALAEKKSELSQDRMGSLRLLLPVIVVVAREKDEIILAQNKEILPSFAVIHDALPAHLDLKNSDSSKEVQDRLVVQMNQLVINEQKNRAEAVIANLSLKKKPTPQQNLNHLTDADLAKLFPDLSKQAQKQIQKVEQQPMPTKHTKNKKKKK